MWGAAQAPHTGDLVGKAAEKRMVIVGLGVAALRGESRLHMFGR